MFQGALHGLRAASSVRPICRDFGKEWFSKKRSGTSVAIPSSGPTWPRPTRGAPAPNPFPPPGSFWGVSHDSLACSLRRLRCSVPNQVRPPQTLSLVRASPDHRPAGGIRPGLAGKVGADFLGDILGQMGRLR